MMSLLYVALFFINSYLQHPAIFLACHLKVWTVSVSTFSKTTN